MERPNTLVGLSLELLRRRGSLRAARPLLVALAALSGVALVARAPRRPGAPPPVDAALSAWRAAPFDGDVAFVDASVVATPGGWLLAWTRWPRRGSPRVQVAVLARDGSLRGAPRTLSADRTWARGPALSRQGDRIAVTWTAMSEDDASYARRPWIAVVDADLRELVAPRALVASNELSLGVSIASDGQGWGVAWDAYNKRGRALCLARVGTDGALRGPVTRVADPSEGMLPSLAWSGDAWFVAERWINHERVRSGLLLRWFDRGGALVETQRVASSLGEGGGVRVFARGATSWLSWGDDGAFSARHDPRFARVEGRRVVAGPRVQGPRRSGSVASVVCTGASSCVSAWVGVADDRDEPTALQVQALDGDGAARGPVRRIGPPAPVVRVGSVGLAYAVDERDAMAVWTLGEGDGYRIMRVRLDANGAPMGEPAVLPLP